MNYQEPPNSSLPEAPLKLEILKSGTILSDLEFQRSKIVCGRLPDCDIVLDHPSSSRYHALFQFMDNDWFIYDLESAHGTFLNKKKLDPKSFVKIYDGDLVKFGGSSRLYIIHGAKERVLQDPKSNVKTSVKQKISMDLEDDQVNLHGKPIPSSVFYKDPKGILSNWFEQQGYDLSIDFSQPDQIENNDQNEYEDEEDNSKIRKGGKQGFIASIQLPVEIISFLATGKALKKKDAEKEVCLAACRKLYEKGLLVDSEAALTEAEKRKIRNQMFGDSDNDDDLVYDKTTKKQKTVQKKKPETFESLNEKRLAFKTELESIQNTMNSLQSKYVAEDEEDSLDAFMTNIESQSIQDSRDSLQKRLPFVKHELEKIEKLLEIVRPSALISSQNVTNDNDLKHVSNHQEFKLPKPILKNSQKTETPIQPPPVFLKPETELSIELTEKKASRQYGAMTLDESAKHSAVETEDVEEAPDLDHTKKSKIADLNAADGY